jgi:hypothetical protein
MYNSTMSEGPKENLPNPDDAKELNNAIADIEKAMPSSKEHSQDFLEETKPHKELPKYRANKKTLIEDKYGQRMHYQEKHVIASPLDVVSNPDYVLPASDVFIERETRDKIPEETTLGFLQQLAHIELEELQKRQQSSEQIEKNLDIIENTAIKMGVGSEINKSDQEIVEHYLETKIYRWNNKIEQTKNEDKIWDYQRASNYLTTLKEKVEQYEQVKDDEIEQEMNEELEDLLHGDVVDGEDKA